jgi:NADH dehydrogenase [ubiquinone] 1 alpha subcomplex assembly factor 6
MLTTRQARVRQIYRTCRQCVRFNSTVPSLACSREYCKNLLRKHDRPSYMQTPFFPQSARDAHLAICALNVEIVLIPDLVGNQNARTMRMQFWKNAVNDCYQGQPKAEPVSILLADVIARGIKLTKAFFQTIISERVWIL